MKLRREFKNQHKQRGFSLIDMAIWLVIAAIVLFGIFYFAKVSTRRQASNKEASSLNLMLTDTRTKFGQQGSFNGITPQVLIQLGIVPSDMVNGAQITSHFNTPVTVAAVNLNGTAGDGVEFTYPIPRENCPDFVSAAEGSAARVTVGGTVVKNNATGINTLQTAAMGAACDSQAGGNVNVALAQGR